MRTKTKAAPAAGTCGPGITLKPMDCYHPLSTHTPQLYDIFIIIIIFQVFICLLLNPKRITAHACTIQHWLWRE